MPVTAASLKKLAHKWILDNVRFEANVGLLEIIGTFRELGMSNDEVRQTLKAALRKRADEIITESLAKLDAS